MSSIAEKMRQFGCRLKCAGAQARLKTASAAGDVAEYWRKVRQRRVDWPTWRSGAPASRADDAWHDPAIAEPVTEAARPTPVPAAGWRARYPRIVKAMRIAAIAVAAYLVAPYPLIVLYSVFDPPVSALMLRNLLTGSDINYEWVDFSDISPNLARAAVIAEDARFCRHSGVDWNAVGEALGDLEEGDTPRGASTIPMQTAKNLFLWPDQSYLRKALEVPLAYFLSAVWSKQRVLEIYLNIAEWGPGVYGAEAASQYHFGKPAASLNPTEAALLVAALPSPLKRNAGRPGPSMQRLASRVQSRVTREAADAACVFNR